MLISLYPFSALGIFNELRLKAVHARDVELSRADDTEIFSYALHHQLILVTKDLGFGNRKMFPPFSSGMIILRIPFYFTAAQFSRVLKNFLQMVHAEELKNRLAIVKVGTYRIRKLGE